MLYELRTYHVTPGRLADLNRRFETVTTKIWEKHGIRQVGFWTAVIGESANMLYYMLAWESLAEREKKWNAFATDPDWVAKRAETEKNGPLVQRLTNCILEPTSYSAMR